MTVEQKGIGMNDLRLEVRDVDVWFGDVAKLSGIDLAVHAHESIALFGPNGHGKTTLLRAVSGLVPVRSGSILLDSESIVGLSPRRIATRGLAHVPQASALFPQLTVAELLDLGAQSRRAQAERTRSREKVFSLFPKLQQRRTQLCGTLSGGERQMAAIGTGIMAAPRLLILDEPTLGLSPIVRREIAAAVNGLRASGLSLIVADGDIDFLFEVSDRFAVVQEGRIVRRGDSSDRPSHDEIMASYFGARS